MDKISDISLDNTVTLKIDCLLNQELLLKNFNIIMDCLKDLQSQIHKHSSDIAGITSLKELFDQLNQQVKQNTSTLNNQSKNAQNNQSQNMHDLDNGQLDNLQKQIKELKERMTKGQGFTTENTKDINLLMSDMKGAKQDIEALKKQLHDIKLTNSTNGSNGSNGNTNLGKNQNLNQEILNDLNKQSQQHNKAISKFEKEMDQMKKHIKKLQNDITGLKTNLDQVHQDKNLEETANNTTNNTDNQNTNGVTIDQKTLNDIMKKIDYLTKKSQNIQSQVLNNTRSINQLNQTAEKTTQQLQQQKDNINNIHLEIQQINRILQQLQNLNNNDNDNLLSEIQKLKDQFEKLLKMINALKNSKSQTDSNLDERNSGSNKNINTKISQDRSFKKRSESVDLNGKIRELTDRIKQLQKLIGQDNPQKLPSIGWKKPNQTSYNGEKSHKKELAQMKNDLEIWIKSYVDSQNKGHGNLGELELKIQEIKNILGRKADHEGMKKGLAFLQGKITQLYMFLTEPESEDAMIVRKGFNCLSCSKKVQNLRGKLGPRMNWDNLNTNHNGQTPPKAGFPKYADSNEKESI